MARRIDSPRSMSRVVPGAGGQCVQRRGYIPPEDYRASHPPPPSPSPPWTTQDPIPKRIPMTFARVHRPSRHHSNRNTPPYPSRHGNSIDTVLSDFGNPSTHCTSVFSSSHSSLRDDGIEESCNAPHGFQGRKRWRHKSRVERGVQAFTRVFHPGFSSPAFFSRMPFK